MSLCLWIPSWHAAANDNSPKFFKIRFSIPKELPIQVTSLGPYLIKLRLEKGLCQKDVAKLLGVANDTVTYWENDRSMPSKENLIKLMKLFDIEEKSFGQICALSGMIFE